MTDSLHTKKFPSSMHTDAGPQELTSQELSDSSKTDEDEGIASKVYHTIANLVSPSSDVAHDEAVSAAGTNIPGSFVQETMHSTTTPGSSNYGYNEPSAEQVQVFVNPRNQPSDYSTPVGGAQSPPKMKTSMNYDAPKSPLLRHDNEKALTGSFPITGYKTEFHSDSPSDIGMATSGSSTSLKDQEPRSSSSTQLRSLVIEDTSPGLSSRKDYGKSSGASAFSNQGLSMEPTKSQQQGAPLSRSLSNPIQDYSHVRSSSFGSSGKVASIDHHETQSQLAEPVTDIYANTPLGKKSSSLSPGQPQTRQLKDYQMSPSASTHDRQMAQQPTEPVFDTPSGAAHAPLSSVTGKSGLPRALDAGPELDRSLSTEHGASRAEFAEPVPDICIPRRSSKGNDQSQQQQSSDANTRSLSSKLGPSSSSDMGAPHDKSTFGLGAGAAAGLGLGAAAGLGAASLGNRDASKDMDYTASGFGHGYDYDLTHRSETLSAPASTLPSSTGDMSSQQQMPMEADYTSSGFGHKYHQPPRHQASSSVSDPLSRSSQPDQSAQSPLSPSHSTFGAQHGEAKLAQELGEATCHQKPTRRVSTEMTPSAIAGLAALGAGLHHEPSGGMNMRRDIPSGHSEFGAQHGEAKLAQELGEATCHQKPTRRVSTEMTPSAIAGLAALGAGLHHDTKMESSGITPHGDVRSYGIENVDKDRSFGRDNGITGEGMSYDKDLHLNRDKPHPSQGMGSSGTSGSRSMGQSAAMGSSSSPSQQYTSLDPKLSQDSHNLSMAGGAALAAGAGAGAAAYGSHKDGSPSTDATLGTDAFAGSSAADTFRGKEAEARALEKNAQKSAQEAKSLQEASKEGEKEAKQLKKEAKQMRKGDSSGPNVFERGFSAVGLGHSEKDKSQQDKYKHEQPTSTDMGRTSQPQDAPPANREKRSSFSGALAGIGAGIGTGLGAIGIHSFSKDHAAKPQTSEDHTMKEPASPTSHTSRQHVPRLGSEGTNLHDAAATYSGAHLGTMGTDVHTAAGAYDMPHHYEPPSQSGTTQRSGAGTGTGKAAGVGAAGAAGAGTGAYLASKGHSTSDQSKSMDRGMEPSGHDTGHSDSKKPGLVERGLESVGLKKHHDTPQDAHSSSLNKDRDMGGDVGPRDTGYNVVGTSSGYDATNTSGQRGLGTSGYDATNTSGRKEAGSSGYDATNTSGQRGLGTSGYDATNTSGRKEAGSSGYDATNTSRGVGAAALGAFGGGALGTGVNLRRKSDTAYSGVTVPPYSMYDTSDSTGEKREPTSSAYHSNRATDYVPHKSLDQDTQTSVGEPTTTDYMVPSHETSRGLGMDAAGVGAAGMGAAVAGTNASHGSHWDKDIQSSGYDNRKTSMKKPTDKSMDIPYDSGNLEDREDTEESPHKHGLLERGLEAVGLGGVLDHHHERTFSDEELTHKDNTTRRLSTSHNKGYELPEKDDDNKFFEKQDSDTDYKARSGISTAGTSGIEKGLAGVGIGGAAAAAGGTSYKTPQSQTESFDPDALRAHNAVVQIIPQETSTEEVFVPTPATRRYSNDEVAYEENIHPGLGSPTRKKSLITTDTDYDIKDSTGMDRAQRENRMAPEPPHHYHREGVAFVGGETLPATALAEREQLHDQGPGYTYETPQAMKDHEENFKNLSSGSRNPRSGIHSTLETDHLTSTAKPPSSLGKETTTDKEHSSEMAGGYQS